MAGWRSSVAFVDATHGWAVGNGGFITATTDGGVHWTEQSLASVPFWFNSVAFVDATHGWAVGGNELSPTACIWATVDGGAHWNWQFYASGPYFTSVAVVDRTHVCVVESWGTIAASTDGGAHWAPQWWGAQTPTSLAFADATHGWAVGESGVILAYTVPPDTTPPITVSDVVPTYYLSATIHLSASDNAEGSGVASTHYKLDGGADTTGTTVSVGSLDGHALEFWSVDVAGNIETPHKAANFVVTSNPLPTSITIKTTATSVRTGNIPILSGAVTPFGMIGKNIVAYVKKPGKAYFSYSSNRTVYNLGGKAAWQYKYYFKPGMVKGYYVFKAVVPAWPGFSTSTSPTTVSIRLR